MQSGVFMVEMVPWYFKLPVCPNVAVAITPPKVQFPPIMLPSFDEACDCPSNRSISGSKFLARGLWGLDVSQD